MGISLRPFPWSTCQPGQQFPERLPRRLLQLGRGRRVVHYLPVRHYEPSGS
jgi:hypothetical protein